MKIETFTFCYNEEKMLPYFLRHYKQYGSVTVFDNYSTDKSVEIAKAGGAIVFQFDTDNKFREDILVHLRNTCWKESKADWVIVCDIDEFVYHTSLIWALEQIQGTVILPRMFEMYSETFPITQGQIYDEVRYGVELRSKMCLFRPSQITEMNYEAGCHHAYPEGNFILNSRTSIVNLHFKKLSVEYVVNRYAELNIRQSKENKQNNWNWHVEVDTENIIKEFKEVKSRLMKIV